MEEKYDTSYKTIIDAIDSYTSIEEDKTKMIKGVFPRAYTTRPGWSGGSFYDALKILGEEAAYDLAMNCQDILIQCLGIPRYYDLEGHDNTVDVLKLTKQILLCGGPHTNMNDPVISSQLGFEVNEVE